MSDATKSAVVGLFSKCGDPLDWGDWPDALDSADTRAVFNRSDASTIYGGSLYHLVDECAQRLELRSVACGESSHAEEFRVPFMESGDLVCGFEVRAFAHTLRAGTSANAAILFEG